MTEIANKNGTKRNQYVKNQGLIGLFLGPCYSILIIGLTYISMSKYVVFFYATSPFLLILSIILFVIAPIRMINIHNRTICSIQLDETNIGIKTFAALWKKPMEWNLSVMQMSVKRSKFQWYGKGEKHGLTIKYKGKEFYLVAEYFDNFEKIQQELC